LRIEAGRPLVGLDMDENTIALEARMESAISFTKGCYEGQEVIARATYQGHMNRLLVGFRIEGDTVPIRGDAVLAARKPIGHATQEEFLEMYGKVFDLLEIDSSFYRIPTPEMTREWKRLVPDGFAFSSKFPKIVTHEREFRQAKEPLERFLRAMNELRPKAKVLLVQLAPSYTMIRGEEELFDFLRSLPKDFRYAVEFRHGSWFNESVFEELRKLD